MDSLDLMKESARQLSLETPECCCALESERRASEQMFCHVQKAADLLILDRETELNLCVERNIHIRYSAGCSESEETSCLRT